MFWNKFDAAEPDPEAEKLIADYARQYCLRNGVEENDSEKIREIAARDIGAYKAGMLPNFDQALSVNAFKPNEFNPTESENKSLDVLLNWLLRANIDWRGRSDNFKALINARFNSIGTTKVDVQGNTMYLDACVEVLGNRVAVEFEVSNNLENGFATLRAATKRRRYADYGVMIVPWLPRSSGMAHARMALNSLDEAADETDQTRNGTIYRVSIIRERPASGFCQGRETEVIGLAWLRRP
ncbi:hypothetical protein ABID16_003100 [Rhizobium aquaticum]|uniref:Uncharacterized protein n=1 Tax=Rhizobium aquaticum TaxID=1549636 RepID=A0ABV2J2B8_9HYPH